MTEMTSFALKLLAVLTMLVDHLGILLHDDKHLFAYKTYVVLRSVGRFAFPIYALLLAEGFRHLRKKPERLKAHALLLAALAVISEFLFDFFDHKILLDVQSQSVMFTLLLGFAGLWLADQWQQKPWVQVGIYLLFGAAGQLIASNYGTAGVLLIFAFSFYLRGLEDKPYWKRFLGVLAVIICYYLFYLWVHSSFSGPATLWRYLKANIYYAEAHLLLVPILAAYSGKLGPRNRILHRCYQWFYPAHLALLCLISALMG